MSKHDSKIALSLRVLMVEDDADQRELVREVVEDHFGEGTIDCVGTIADALTQNLAAYDLIITDQNLPDGSGMQLLSDILKRCNTPVIMVTGENSGELAAQAIQRGATDYVVKTGEYMFTIPLVIEKNLTVAKLKKENQMLHVDLQKALDDVRQTNEQLESTLKHVEQMAATDPLTGLYNRRHFGKVLEQHFSESQRHGHDISIVMIDLDGYKQLNDNFGHAVGDQLLTLTGKVITTNLRRGDVAARYGGDEFILLLPHAGSGQAETVVQRIREDFKTSSSQMLKRPLGVSMSIGVASQSACSAVSAEQLSAAADAVLYEAKKTGKDRVCCATGAKHLQKVPA